VNDIYNISLNGTRTVRNMTKHIYILVRVKMKTRTKKLKARRVKKLSRLHKKYFVAGRDVDWTIARPSPTVFSTRSECWTVTRVGGSRRVSRKINTHTHARTYAHIYIYKLCGV